MTQADINRGIRIEESAIGSAIVSGDGNTIYVIQQTLTQQQEPKAAATTQIGPNPYKGLAAFQESDADRYFGREQQIKRLRQHFQQLYEQTRTPRLLPILGPSGCGKSSLARAGFIPALARQPLPGKEKMRVAVLVPGTRPLEALAGVLAKAATSDPLPAEKAEEFERVLKRQNEAGEYEGLRRISSLIPSIREIPLVILVDQFEEVYSLCKEPEQRQAFINTLLHAASDPTGEVSVVITLRSDFWGETQRHQQLNQIIGSDWSVNVPSMTEAELRNAIAEPAKQAGQALDEATIDLLIKDAKGHAGALPLLQVTLARIWEGLEDGKAPISTYREIGGVGGALARKAQEIYNSLNPNEQSITRRIFCSLVHLQEGIQYIRKRLPESNLMSIDDEPLTFQDVIRRFSQEDARLLTRTSHGKEKTVEVTHEALFEHWPALNAWLNNRKIVIQEKQSLEYAASEWEKSHRAREYLLTGKRLQRAHEFSNQNKDEFPLSVLASDYVQKSLYQRNRERKRVLCMYGVSALAIIMTASLSSWIVGNERQRSQYESEKSTLLQSTIDTPYQEELLDTAFKVIAEADDIQTRLKAEDQGKLNEAIRYYRQVILFSTNSGELESKSNIDCQTANSSVKELYCQAIDGLSRILDKSYLKTLSQQIQDDQIGEFIPGDRSQFENLFSDGALKTTYSLLWREQGVKADVDDSGTISKPEAEKIPCVFLKRLEEIWLEQTDNQCGWFDRSENTLFVDLDCDHLNGYTLTLRIVEDIANSDYLIGRLQACKLIPNNVIER